jgi:hypothetical protein
MTDPARRIVADGARVWRAYNRASGRAKTSARPGPSIPDRYVRAGFEPRRGCVTTKVCCLSSAGLWLTLGKNTRTARLKTGAVSSHPRCNISGAPRFSPHRTQRNPVDGHPTVVASVNRRDRQRALMSEWDKS